MKATNCFDSEIPLPKDAVKLEFAKRLNNAMLEKGWNQSELANRASKYGKAMGRYSVSCYLRGHSLPRPAQLTALAKALGKSPSELLPTRGAPSAETKIPAIDISDMGGGKVWLRVNRSVNWSVAAEIMRLLEQKN